MGDQVDAVAVVQEVRDILNINHHLLRRTRDRIDPFDEYSDSEFRKRYRLTKVTAKYVIDLVSNQLGSHAYRFMDITPALQVLVTLRYYAKGCYQVQNGDIHGLGQSTVSRIVARVSRVLAALRPQFVQLPARLAEEKTRFYNIRRFPNVVGCIDCTHVRIKCPNKEQAMYYCNRKGYYSLNVQVVCDADCKILDIVAKWRGSVHDARIWDECSLKQDFEDKRKNGLLLGDGGYKCTPYLLAPLLNPQSPAENRYNRSHIATRVVIERCFGQWKGMFKALQVGMQISLTTAKTAIVAMAVIYYIRKMQGDEECDSDPEDISDDEDSVATIQPNEDGNMHRRQFIQDHFQN